ncbi:cysteine desulfurase-like protein [Undibacterium sp. LX40W]|uniref:Cysteine desulfurase-like protein n=1 Tax=Undibacterium nitidum TaxID=2762298 RepID=A0A923KNA1_9BURK|nr:MULTISPECIES: cysteine desulfurase-like protein [Undibacterium]MBC3880428.1 cysteine desulfurase-like protein [Undibacterium nitidum]MBC3890836.1 cysteine desulfurase-like protein [Undibacterium sp. LX40W]
MKLSELELQTVRSEFPVFAQHNPTLFLDNAGGSQVLGRVANRISTYLLTTSVQLGASYSTSQQASERVLQARRDVAELINAPDDREVVMGGSTTGLMFLLIQAIMPSIQAGDEVIITNTDHEANIGAWKRLQAAGAIIKVWEVNPNNMLLELSSLQQLLNSRTKWVAMTHASNVLGTINPVAEVARVAHAVGARLCVDGVAYAPHRLVDVQASGADIYVFSFYKVFGPHYAVLWGHFELLEKLAGLNHFFIGSENLPYKLQPGNVNFELSYGCAGIREYLIAIGESFGGKGSTRELMQHAFDRFEAHENSLAEQLLSFLRSRPQVRIIGLSEVAQDACKRVPTISFVVEGKDSESIVHHIDQYGIGIRYGDFYAKHLIHALDVEKHGGVVRVSIAHYNSSQEIDRLIEHLSEII